MIIAATVTGIILIFLAFLTSCMISDSEDGKVESGVTLGVIIAILVFIEVILISCIFSDTPLSNG